MFIDEKWNIEHIPASAAASLEAGFFVVIGGVEHAATSNGDSMEFGTSSTESGAISTESGAVSGSITISESGATSEFNATSMARMIFMAPDSMARVSEKRQ